MSKPISWDDQRLFLAVLEEGSLSAAARRLMLSQPTVRVRIEGLERSLGTVLFTRSANGLVPTKEALALHASARAMAMASERFIRLASAPVDEIGGTVRLSVPELMGVEVVPDILAGLRRSHPAIRVELSLSNAPADLLEQEADLAIRTFAPKQEALVARKVASIPLGFFASPAYLSLRGTPGDLADLATHDLIGSDRNARELALASALVPMLPVSAWALRTDSHPAQIAAARAGVGICVTQVTLGERDPHLRRVLPGFVVATLDTWVVTHENLRNVPRVRTVFDALAAAFKTPARNSTGRR
ncbi:LysR family transcriptional regulator [Bauldia sp.]|uniref:LysR family transcriptional regulator n=1 Tax=Bauldia sp. TaxID=2575872 RepID=UPI003BA87C02